jgi:transcriptional regulator with XRE-family HTH domain
MDLKEQRIKLGLTQMEMATACGVAMSTYRMWEYGMPPTEENRKKLEEVLKHAAETNHS